MAIGILSSGKLGQVSSGNVLGIDSTNRIVEVPSTNPYVLDILPSGMIGEVSTALTSLSGTVTSISYTGSPGARAANSLTYLNGKVYMYGGANGPTGSAAQMWVYDVATQAWTLEATRTGYERVAHIQFTDGSKIYIMGGRDGGGYYVSTVFAYDPVAMTFTDLAPIPYGYSQAATGAYCDGTWAYVCLPPPDSLTTFQTFAYRLSDGAYGATGNSTGGVWGGALARTSDGNLWIVGGNVRSGGTSYQVQKYKYTSGAAPTYVYVYLTELHAFGQNGAVAIGTDVYYWGGKDGTTYNDRIMKYDTIAGTFSLVAYWNPSYIFNFGTCQLPDNSALTYGGEDNYANISSTLYHIT